MRRLGPFLAVTIAILAIGYSGALVDWGVHHTSWLLFVAILLVFAFLATGGYVIDALIDERDARSVRSPGVSAPTLPRPRSPRRPDVHARVRHGMSPRARVTGDRPAR